MAMLITIAFGFSYGIAMWIPYALLSEYGAQLETTRQNRQRAESGLPPSYVSIARTHEKEDSFMTSGVIVGVHNIAICLPQFLGMAASAVFLATFVPRNGWPAAEDDHMVSGDRHDGIGSILRFGAACAVAAALLSLSVKDLNKEEKEKG